MCLWLCFTTDNKLFSDTMNKSKEGFGLKCEKQQKFKDQHKWEAIK